MIELGRRRRGRQRYAERQRWKLEILSTSDAAAGGFKEVIALISAPGGKVYSKLKY